MSDKMVYKDCYEKKDGDCLVIGNSRIERTWDLSQGLKTVSLKSKDSRKEWVFAGNKGLETFVTHSEGSFPLSSNKDFGCIRVESVKEKDNGVKSPCLHTIVALFNKRLSVSFKKHILIYPEVAAFHIFLEIESRFSITNLSYSHVDNFGHSLQKGKFTVVELKTGTDNTNDLVSEREGKLFRDEKKVFRMKGSIFFLEDMKGDGIFLYKESPVSLAPSVSTEWDFYISSKQVGMVGLGFDSLRPQVPRVSYGLGLGFYSGGKDYALAGLREYQFAKCRIKAKEGFSVLSNDWGDTSSLDENKVIKDLKVASQLGIPQHTMDAGWCEGEDTINQKNFPKGWSYLKKMSKKTSVELGLWTMPMMSEQESISKRCPDWIAKTNNLTPCEEITAEVWGKKKNFCSMDLCHPEYFSWKKKFYLTMFRKHRITFFKLDFSQLNLYHSERGDFYAHYQAYERLISEIKEEEPDIWFSFDATRVNRPAYHFGLQYGSIFLENRYTRSKGPKKYRPYKTLASLWQIAAYIPAQRLEIEICPDERGYSASYLFATAMFAIPLFWGFLFKISESSKKEFASLIRLYLKHYIKIRKGVILPIGDRPDGKSWTGLQSHNFKKNSGYLIIFREDNPAKEKKLRLKFLKKKKVKFVGLLKKEVIFKSKSENEIKFTLPQKRSFNVYYYEVYLQN